MPTVSVNRDNLFKALGQEYTDEAFDELCFEFGIELDDIVIEDNQVIYKIDIGANRYDLLCIQGISLALNAFRNTRSYPIYKKLPANPANKIVVKQSTEQIRPFVVGAILRNISFNEETYNNFIDLQDKLHQNICRKRKYASIGTHDLDTIQGPFVYEALSPEKFEFVALKQSKKMTAKDLIKSYEHDMFFKQYIGLIKDSPVYPVIKDSNNTVLSLPPIVNGEHSKISTSTKNVFIEVTCLDLTKGRIVLDTVCSMFSIYCKDKYTVEQVESVYEIDSTRNATFPDLEYRETKVSCDYINNRIGINQTRDQICDSLTKMGLSATLDNTSKTDIIVTVPPTRSDILQACDIMEDAAVAYGFNNIPVQLPKTLTVGKQQQLNKLTDLLRIEMANCGYTECLTFALCSKDDVSKNLCQPLNNKVVHISNPKTLEFQVCRTSLLPGVLKTVFSNKSLKLPLKVFEISDCVEKSDNEVGAKNIRKLCACYYSQTGALEHIIGLVDRLMIVLEISNYRLEPCNNSTFFKNRSCNLIVNEINIGQIGVLHPNVLNNFELSCPCTVVEFNVEYFHDSFVKYD